MEVEFDPYRFGIVLGVIVGWAMMSIFEAIEVLTFNGLFIEWTQTRAFLALTVGVLQLMLAWTFHRWFKAKLRTAEVSA